MKIDQQILNRLRALQSERDQIARQLGQASIDRILSRAKLLHSGISNQELYYQIGIAQVEFENLENLLVSKITLSKKATEESGTHAIRSAGLDPAARDYTINLETGEIFALKAGKWEAVP